MKATKHLSVSQILGAILCAVIVLLALPSKGAPQQSSPAKAAALAADTLVLLETHCVKCHGGEQTKAGLDLKTRAGLLRGGETGPAVVPGSPDGSLLMQMVRHQKTPGMPHKQEKLPEEAIARLAAWIKEGAPYSRPLKPPAVSSPQPVTEPTLTAAEREHWAFQRVKRPVPPVVSHSRAMIINPIDQFILATLETNGLSFSPSASRATLLRRVTFDLIGLPPTPEEIDSFVNDTAGNAYEKLIERLLASPHYGERWGRHWLDLTRYAETDGFEHDAVRPHAWRYRDYVIRSFNEDGSSASNLPGMNFGPTIRTLSRPPGSTCSAPTWSIVPTRSNAAIIRSTT